MKRSDELAMVISPLAALIPAGVLSGELAPYVLVFGSLLSYLVTLAICWPALVFLRRRGRARAWSLSLVGLASSAPLAVLFMDLGWALTIGILLSGLSGGLLVWFVAVGPNNSFKPKPLRGSA